MRRLVHLLTAKELTPRQRWNRKYRMSAKGRAANARHYARRMADPAAVAKKRASTTAWKKAHALQVRAYNRVANRLWRRRRKQDSPK